MTGLSVEVRARQRSSNHGGFSDDGLPPQEGFIDQCRGTADARRKSLRRRQRRQYRRRDGDREICRRRSSRRRSSGAVDGSADAERENRQFCSTLEPMSIASPTIWSSLQSWAIFIRERFLEFDGRAFGLLSIGEEDSKGNELTKEVFKSLKRAPINFIGNVEGRDIFKGDVDVIVCDGFTGNVVLKLSEGLYETFSRNASP